jgi:hypothetical protein
MAGSTCSGRMRENGGRPRSSSRGFDMRCSSS